MESPICAGEKRSLTPLGIEAKAHISRLTFPLKQNCPKEPIFQLKPGLSRTRSEASRLVQESTDIGLILRIL